MSESVTLISAMTALAAVIFAPLISVYVAKREINAATVSVNRQAWIDRLRDELATLVAIVRHVPNAYHAETITKADAIAKHGELTTKVEVIKLLINPGEPEHSELVRLIESASKKVIAAIDGESANAIELEKAGERIVKTSQGILKEEWERVKKGD